MTSDGSLVDCEGDDSGHSVVAIFSFEHSATIISAEEQLDHRRHNRHQRHVRRSPSNSRDV